MNINLYSPIGGTGYGVAGINLYKQLSKDNNIALFPMGNPNIEYESDVDIIQKGLQNQAEFDYNAPCIKIWHQFDLANKIGNGKYFAFPFFELTLLNEREIHHLNFPDELVVSSQWAKEVLLQNNITQLISVVPLGVDREIFNHELFTSNKIEDKYIFITVGKWEKRKSHDIVIELFNRAFSPEDNVELWMVTHNPFLPQEIEEQWHNLAENSKMRQHIKIFPRIRTQKELANIISYANCGVYISRSEGWNLDMLETMSLDKPVIVTNYSAHTEFCNSNNSLLVDITELEDANDGLWFKGFGQWAKIGDQQKDQIVDYMKYVYKNQIKNNPNGILTAKEFSWKNSADKLLRCISS
jgi:glycosyltransferase involved in cell wall biosynthesis